MRKIVMYPCGCGRFAAVWTRPASAQVLYGSIVGTVQDESGAAVPNAAISIVNNATTQSRATVPSDEGAFALHRCGGRIVHADGHGEGLSGVAHQQRAGGDQCSVPQRRAAAGRRTGGDGNVEASAAVLQTDTADVHVSLGSRQITELPLPGYRNYQSLINLVPGRLRRIIKTPSAAHPDAR